MKTIIIAALLLAAVSAQAQVRKCTGPDGKVTYSDFICGKDTANETGVRTDANTIVNSPNGGRPASKCDAAISAYKTATARKPPTLTMIHAMPEYVAVKAVCGQAMQAGTIDQSECTAALAKYKQESGGVSINQVPYTNAAMAVNAKCGEGTIKGATKFQVTDQKGNVYEGKVKP